MATPVGYCLTYRMMRETRRVLFHNACQVQLYATLARRTFLNQVNKLPVKLNSERLPSARKVAAIHSVSSGRSPQRLSSISRLTTASSSPCAGSIVQRNLTPSTRWWRQLLTSRLLCSKVNGPVLFDPGTGDLQSLPDDLDFFTVFGLEKAFLLDTSKLAQVYKQLQRQLHPDKFSNKSQAQKDLSLKWSSLVNTGYKTLQKPLPRALYLLDLLKHPLEEEQVQVDTPFLMEIMELNEDVIDADMTELAELKLRVKISLDDYVKQIEDCFQSGDLESARRTVAFMKYYANIMDKIIDKEA